MRNNIYICGTGNVAKALLGQFRRHKIPVAGVFSRTAESIDNDVTLLKYGAHIPEKNSLVFLTVPDQFVAETEKAVGKGGYYSVHSGGSVNLNELKSEVKGVFYPLQSFSADLVTTWENIPILIESNDEYLLEQLFELAAAFGSVPVEADSVQREALHLAAVFANNFSNAMFMAAQELITKTNLDPRILNPLIRKTVGKLQRISARDAMTGPARRHDHNTMERHIQMLEGHPDLQQVYRDVSGYIGHVFQND